MLTFEQFLHETAEKGEAVNLLFEERFFALVGILEKISDPLIAEEIPHEVIGGVAMLIYVEEADPSQTPLTRDVDIMIHRSDLERVKEIAQRHGFRFRHAAGVDMLLYGDKDSAKNAVHLVFSGEKVEPGQATPNPPLSPERKSIHGKEFWVIPMIDLIRMKLSAYRLKDQSHIKVMDAVGLITPEVERALPKRLQSRLQRVREKK